MFRRIFLTCLALLLIVSLAHAEKIKLTDVQLEGNDRVDGATVRAVLTVRPGKEVTLEDIDRDLQAIFKLGHFDDITAELREDGGGKVLVFIVHERPLLREISFDGFKKLTEDKLQPLVTIKVPEIYDPVKVRQSIEAMRELYHIEGYYAVKIEPELSTDERNESLLTFKIVEGEKVLIDEVVFEGNQIVDSGDLADAMKTKERWMFSWITGRGTYMAEAIQIDVEEIKALYFDLGYMDAKIKQPQISLVKNDKYMKLLIEIDEGQQYKNGKLRIAGDLIRPRKELKNLLTLKENMVFNRSELRKSVLKINDLYADEGYANVNVIPFTSKDPDALTIDVKFEIEQGELIYIEKINITGNTITRDKVIRRDLTLIEGDKYSASKIRSSRKRLRNLGFFEEINISTGPGSDSTLNTLDVEVEEKPTGSFTIGFGYSSVDSFIGQGSITQANFLGYGIVLNASATIGGTTQLFKVGVTDPHFLDSKWMAGTDLYKTERKYSDFSERATGGAIRAGRSITRYARGMLTYRYEEKEIYDVLDFVTSPIILDQEGESTLSAITATVTRNSTDYRLDPSHGGFSTLSNEFAGLGGSEHFNKIDIGHRHFFSLFWGTVFAVNGAMGYVFKTADDEIPVGQRYFLGGLRSIRGFQTREVGPKDGDSFIGGEKAAYFNFDYLFPINKKYGLKGLFFFDTGNAWLEEEAFFSDMRYSAGYGIRWFSPLGPLRFEWGYNLDPREGEKDSVFEFSIGSYF